jgi:hypothetical protein
MYLRNKGFETGVISLVVLGWEKKFVIVGNALSLIFIELLS